MARPSLKDEVKRLEEKVRKSFPINEDDFEVMLAFSGGFSRFCIGGSQMTKQAYVEILRGLVLALPEEHRRKIYADLTEGAPSPLGIGISQGIEFEFRNLPDQEEAR